MDGIRENLLGGASASTGNSAGAIGSGPVTAIRRCRYGYFMFLRGDTYVGRSLELYGEYSEAEVALFRELLRPGAVVVEAGANLGALTVPLAAIVGPAGRVVAAEPQGPLYNVLCGNLALNGIMNVIPLRAAMGRANGQVTVPVVGYEGKGNYGGVAVNGDGATRMESVPQVSIDALRLGRLDLLKADVEGSEVNVLTGAAESIRQHRPILFVENDRQEKSRELIELISGFGYRMWWHFSPLFNPENFNGNPANVFGRTVSINMLCLPEDKPFEVRGLREVGGPEDWWR